LNFLQQLLIKLPNALKLLIQQSTSLLMLGSVQGHLKLQRFVLGLRELQLLLHQFFVHDLFL